MARTAKSSVKTEVDDMAHGPGETPAPSPAAPTSVASVPHGTTRPNGSNGNGHGSATALAEARPWTVKDSARLYGIRNWGQGYFSVNDEGHVAVHPAQDPNSSIDLKKLVDELRERDIQCPVLIRFTDILKHRVGQIHQAF